MAKSQTPSNALGDKAHARIKKTSFLVTFRFSLFYDVMPRHRYITPLPPTSPTAVMLRPMPPPPPRPARAHKYFTIMLVNSLLFLRRFFENTQNFRFFCLVISSSLFFYFIFSFYIESRASFLFFFQLSCACFRAHIPWAFEVLHARDTQVSNSTEPADRHQHSLRTFSRPCTAILCAPLQHPQKNVQHAEHDNTRQRLGSIPNSFEALMSKVIETMWD